MLVLTNAKLPDELPGGVRTLSVFDAAGLDPNAYGLDIVRTNSPYDTFWVNPDIGSEWTVVVEAGTELSETPKHAQVIHLAPGERIEDLFSHDLIGLVCGLQLPLL